MEEVGPPPLPHPTGRPNTLWADGSFCLSSCATWLINGGERRYRYSLGKHSCITPAVPALPGEPQSMGTELAQRTGSGREEPHFAFISKLV